MKNIIKISLLCLFIGAPLFTSCKDETKEEELIAVVDQYQTERDQARKIVDNLENLFSEEKEYYYIKINVAKTPEDIKKVLESAKKDNEVIDKVKRKYYRLLDELEHLAPQEREQFKSELDNATERTVLDSLIKKAEEVSSKYIYLNDALLKRSKFINADGISIAPIEEHKNKFTREALRDVVKVDITISGQTDEKYGFYHAEYCPNIEEATIRNFANKDVDISFLKKLKKLNISNNEVSTLKFGNLIELVNLKIYGPNLRELDLSGCPNIKDVDVNVSSLEEFKLHDKAELEILKVRELRNLKKQIDFNITDKLREFVYSCYNLSIAKIQNPNLWDFSKAESLETFRVIGLGHRWERLKFSNKATKLIEVRIEDSNIAILDCSNLLSTKKIDLRSSVINEIIFPEAGGVENVFFDKLFGFSELDFSKQKDLKGIYISDNDNKILTDAIGTLNLVNLETAYFDCPLLKELNISNSKKLRILRVYKATKFKLPDGKMEENGFKLEFKDDQK